MSEKLKMKSEKLRVPTLRFKEFSAEWEEKKLGDISKITMGQSPSSSSYNENNNGIPLIQGNADCKNRKTVPRIYTTEITKECFIGDIIMTVRAPVGAISKSFHNSCIGRGVCAIKPKENNEYIYQFLIRYEESWAKYSQGSTFTAVNSSDIKNLKINLPQKKEQEKIASFLSSIDKKIEQLSKKDELLESYKKGVMQKIFSQEIRFKDYDGSDYSDWEEKKIKDITTKKSSNISANTLEENIGVFKIYGATGFLKSIDFYTEEEKYISIVKDGAGVGRVLLCDAKSSVLGTLDIIKNIENINLHFIYLLLTKIHFEKYMVGSTIPHIYYKDYSNEKIKIPCLEEQTKIANFLSSIDTNISQNKKTLEETKKFKKALLQQMFV